MDLCSICLRTDRSLNHPSSILKEFHDELCDFTVGTVVSSCYYCFECEYLLKKFYRFKQKCVHALNVYQKWKSSKFPEPVSQLHKNVPSSLGLWVPDPNWKFQFLSKDLQMDTFADEMLLQNTYTDEIKLDDGQISYIDDNLTDILKIGHAIVLPKTENDGTNIINSERQNDHLITNLDNILDDSHKLDRVLNDSERVGRVLNDPEEFDKVLVDTDKLGRILDDSGSIDTDLDDIEILGRVWHDSDDSTHSSYESVDKTRYVIKNKYSLKKIPSRLEKVKKKSTDKRQIQLEKSTGKRQIKLEKANEESTTKREIQLQNAKEKSITTRLIQLEKCTGKRQIELEKDTGKRQIRSKKSTEKTQIQLEKCKGKRQNQSEKAKENDGMCKSVFDIEYLTTQEQKFAEFERRKTYECYTSAEHKCEVCYQVFKSAKFVEYHTNKWHTETAGNVCCSICQIWHSRTSSHRLTHSVVFKCKLCPLVTYHRESMQNHYKWHQGEQYHCAECDVTYKSNSAYRTHLGKVHRLGRNVCEECGRGFYSQLGLAIHKNTSSRCHVKESVTKAEGVRCDECDVTFATKEVYDAHISDVHETPKPSRGRPLAVDSSGLPQYRIFNRKRKTRQVRVKPQHTCRVCNEVGLSFGWLQLHFRTRHPTADMDALYADKKRHLCDVCGTGFSKIYALRDHINIHTGARPYACDLCPKRFRSAILKNDHRLRHFPSTKACDYCGKRFKTLANLYNHAKIHTGEKNYKCDVCGKGFLHRASLREHVRGVHYNIRRAKRGAGGKGATDGKRGAAGGQGATDGRRGAAGGQGAIAAKRPKLAPPNGENARIDSDGSD